MLSTITASNDLTSIFRKLQLDSRSELRATLAGGSPVPA
jgi:DNA-binding CsgD family transcriptional regulator